MRLTVVTLFPEWFESPLRLGLLGKALASGVASVGFVDPRTFTTDKHRTVDDTPYGGGSGMVMKPDPLKAAIAAARAISEPARVVLLTPQGRPARQKDLVRWASLPHLVLVAGRYEGFDERVRAMADEEISAGDFVLTGGEYAALALIDGVVRLLPGTLGNAASAAHDSFSAGLLEHPQYTRPEDFEGARVPDVLLSGDHAAIARWRHAQALLRTRARRPDLLAERGVTREEAAVLRGAPPARPGIAVCVPADTAPLPDLIALCAAFALDALWVVGGDASPAPARDSTPFPAPPADAAGPARGPMPSPAPPAAVHPTRGLAPSPEPPVAGTPAEERAERRKVRGAKARARAAEAEQARAIAAARADAAGRLRWAASAADAVAWARAEGRRVLALPRAPTGGLPEGPRAGIPLLLLLEPGDLGVDGVLPAPRASSHVAVPGWAALVVALERLVGEG